MVLNLSNLILILIKNTSNKIHSKRTFVQDEFTSIYLILNVHDFSIVEIQYAVRAVVEFELSCSYSAVRNKSELDSCLSPSMINPF